MNAFKNLNLRSKLIAGFCAIAIFSAVLTFLGIRFSVLKIEVDTLPSQRLFSTFTQVIIKLRSEPLEFIRTGDQGTKAEVQGIIEELDGLTARLSEQAGEPGKTRAFTELAETTQVFAGQARAIIQSHTRTLDDLAELERLEGQLDQAASQARDEIKQQANLDMSRGDYRALQHSTYPLNEWLEAFLQNTGRLMGEALEYAATGSPDATADYAAASAQLRGLRSELQAAPYSGLLQSSDELLALADRIEGAASQTIDSHRGTLELLRGLETQEGVLEGRLTEVEIQLQADVKNGLQSASWIALLAAFASGVLFVLFGWFTSGQLVRPLLRLVRSAEQLGSGDLTVRAEVTSADELGKLAEAFNQMASQLQGLIASLNLRARQVQTSAEVSRRLSTILEADRLVKEVVDQVQAAFGYYHAHIYLFDERQEYLVMAGGTGPVGQTLLERGHKIPRGKGLVGRAAETGAVVLAPDVAKEPGWLSNPLLPETRAEIAVPIATREAVLGVLDVQQNVANGLTGEDAVLLQAVSDQVAIAVQNARTYARLQRQADREAKIASVAHKIQATTTVEEALQLAVRELGRVLGVPQVRVRLNRSVLPSPETGAGPQAAPGD